MCGFFFFFFFQAEDGIRDADVTGVQTCALPIFSTAARGQTTGFNGTSFAASLEGGYPFALDFWGASAEPQVQLIYQSLDFGQRTDIDGIHVALGNPNQGIARVGVRLFKPLTDAE